MVLFQLLYFSTSQNCRRLGHDNNYVYSMIRQLPICAIIHLLLVQIMVRLARQEAKDGAPPVVWKTDLSLNRPMGTSVEIYSVPEFISTTDLFLPTNSKDKTIKDLMFF